MPKTPKRGIDQKVGEFGDCGQKTVIAHFEKHFAQRLSREIRARDFYSTSLSLLFSFVTFYW